MFSLSGYTNCLTIWSHWWLHNLVTLIASQPGHIDGLTTRSSWLSHYMVTIMASQSGHTDGLKTWSSWWLRKLLPPMTSQSGHTDSLTLWSHWLPHNLVTLMVSLIIRDFEAELKFKFARVKYENLHFAFSTWIANFFGIIKLCNRRSLSRRSNAISAKIELFRLNNGGSRDQSSSVTWSFFIKRLKQSITCLQKLLSHNGLAEYPLEHKYIEWFMHKSWHRWRDIARSGITSPNTPAWSICPQNFHLTVLPCKRTNVFHDTSVKKPSNETVKLLNSKVEKHQNYNCRGC